jgi:hypothetical protein
VRAALDIWPPLPINISRDGYGKNGSDVDNIVAALEHKDRVRKINLCDVSSPDLENILAVMGEPFVALVDLELIPASTFGFGPDPPVVRVFDPFLGGSAPSLRTLSLDRVTPPFLGFQKVLLSATGLVTLLLKNIHDSAYFSPDAIVTCLSALTKLKYLEITFQSARSRPVRGSRHPPPLTRTLLPALTKLTFQGVSEYLEDLVAQIDAPRLQALSITFFHQLFIHTPQLSRFISRAPGLKGHDEARVVFTHRSARVTFRSPSRPNFGEQEIRVTISCKHPDLQHLSLVQVCTSSFPQAFISTVKHLYVLESREYQEYEWKYDAEDLANNVQNAQWLQLLLPFIAVKDFYISERIVPLIAPALRELVGERVTEALPALECLFLDGLRASGPVRDVIGPFVAARQLSTHPIAASYWDYEEDDWFEGDD